MSKEQSITKLTKTLGEKHKKINELNKWLTAHFDSPERSKIIGDINALTVDIKTLRFKIDNLYRNVPLLGYELEEQEVKNENPKQNKSI